MMILFLEKTWFLWWIFAVAAILRWFHGIAAGPELGNPETCVEAGKENTQDLGGATFPSAPRGLTLLVRSHPGPPSGGSLGVLLLPSPGHAIPACNPPGYNELNFPKGFAGCWDDSRDVAPKPDS